MMKHFLAFNIIRKRHASIAPDWKKLILYYRYGNCILQNLMQFHFIAIAFL